MTRDRRLDMLAGMEAGVLGGVAMLLSFAFFATLLGYSWWLIPNLMASRIYHRGLLHAGTATVAGSAWVLVGAAAGGVVHALFTPAGRLSGLAIAALSWLVSWAVVWKRAAPLMTVHAPQSVVLAGFLVYGMVLAHHGQFRKSLDH